MKLIVGLGNPTETYANTKHNIGFMTLDYFASLNNLDFKEEKRFKGQVAIKNFNSEKVIFLKPSTYMNLSGDSLILLKNYFKVDIKDILVIVDDLDSNLGRVRLREKGASGGHNGLKSIINVLHTDTFNRIKIGIGRNPNLTPAEYVLSKFSSEELVLINEAIKEASLAIKDFIDNIPFMKISSKYSKK